jgi:hypothetical protein
MAGPQMIGVNDGCRSANASAIIFCLPLIWFTWPTIPAVKTFDGQFAKHLAEHDFQNNWPSFLAVLCRCVFQLRTFPQLSAKQMRSLEMLKERATALPARETRRTRDPSGRVVRLIIGVAKRCIALVHSLAHLHSDKHVGDVVGKDRPVAAAEAADARQGIGRHRNQ